MHRNQWKTLVVVALLLLLPWLPSADAQQFVRPSNGNSVTVTNDFVVNGTATFTSSAFGFSGFAGMTVRFQYDRAASLCLWMPQIDILGAEAANGTFSDLGTDHSRFVPLQTSTTTSYYVPVAIPFIKVKLSSNSEAGSGSQNCHISAFISPTAFASTVAVSGAFSQGEYLTFTNYAPVLVGGTNGGSAQTLRLSENGTLFVAHRYRQLSGATPSNPVDVSTSATLIYSTQSGGGAGFTFQNTSSQPVYCGFSNSVTSSHFAIVLSPDSVGSSAPRGDGGSWTEDDLQLGVNIYCIVGSGSGAVAVTRKISI